MLEKNLPQRSPSPASEPRDGLAQERGLELRRLAGLRSPGWVDVCLEAALEDPHPFPRAEGAAALAGASDELLIPRLLEQLDPSLPPAQRWRAERLLLRREPTAAVEALRRELDLGDRSRSLRAIEALGRLGVAASAVLTELARHEDVGLRRRSIKSLGQLGTPEAFAPVARALGDDDSGVRLAALRALDRLVDGVGGAEVQQVRRPLLSLIADDAEEVRVLALRLVGRLGLSPGASDGAADGWSPLVNDFVAGRGPLESAAFLEHAGRHDELVQVALGGGELAAAAALALAFGAASADRLSPLLTSGDPAIRAVVVRGLARRAEELEARTSLSAALDDDDEGVRWLAREALSGRLDERREGAHRRRAEPASASARWPFGLPAPERVSGARRPRLPLAVAALNLSYNLNLGVLIRSAEAAGAEEVLIVGRDFFHRQAAMGTDRWVEQRFFNGWGALEVYARARAYQLVVVQQSPGAVRFDLAEYPPRPCLVVGSEGPGVSRELCAHADLVVEIPQPGEIDSLNVANAATLVLWACLARRGWL